MTRLTPEPGHIRPDGLGIADTRAAQQRALAIEEAVFGSDHPEVARTLGNLGNVQRKLGEFEVARATLQRALAIFEAAYGSDPPGRHPHASRTSSGR